MSSACGDGADLGPEAGDDGPVGDLVFGDDMKNYRDATLNQNDCERYFDSLNRVDVRGRGEPWPRQWPTALTLHHGGLSNSHFYQIMS